MEYRTATVFVDLYFLRKIVRPGGLIVLDDCWAPSVRTAARYCQHNLSWTAIPDAFGSGTRCPMGTGPAAAAEPRCRAFRLPDPSFEPPFRDFRPFLADGDRAAPRHGPADQYRHPPRLAVRRRAG
jgi:hypothetical protein